MLRHKPSFRKIQLVYVYKSFYKKAYGDSKENDMQVFNKKKTRIAFSQTPLLTGNILLNTAIVTVSSGLTASAKD